MMKTTLMKIAFVLFYLTTSAGTSNICFAAEGDPSSAFNNYQKSYQSNDFEAARTTIEEALKSHTHNSYLIYNLGLTEYKLGKTGLAIGLWRKALSINPQLNEARQAVDFAVSQMSAKPLAKTTDSTWVWLEKLIVDHLSFNMIWPFFLLSLFVSGFMFIKFLGAKRKAFANDEATPILGTKPILFLVITVCLGVVSFFSFKDLVTTKATTIVKLAEVKTGPNAEYGTLFEIPEGTEVLIRDKEAEWYKIEDPTGRVGWAARDQLFVTNTF
ncbi:MAG: SH3 domain-containing protein [Bdellovibrionota bacterium]